MAAASNDDEVENYDEAPTFIDMNSAVEVNVPDDDTNINEDDDDMMEDEDNMNIMESNKMDGSSSDGVAQESSARVIVDQSNATFTSHTDAVYAISSYYDPKNHTLSIVSGGGDDRAYLHQITNNVNGIQHTYTVPLSHPHTDSISCVAFNTSYIDNDVSGVKQRNLLAVGSYDGSIVLYDAGNNNQEDGNNNNASLGQLIQVLEGPSDVEFVTFHPKGGTVLLAGSIADGTIWMYHTPTNSCLQVFVGHDKGGVTAGNFTPDGKWVVSVGQDGTCRVWAPKKGICKHVFRLMDNSEGEDGPGAGLTCLAVGGGSDGQLALCGGEDGKAYVVHVSGKKLVATLPHFDEAAAAAKTTSSANNNGMNNNDNDEDMDDGEMGEARSIEAVGFCPSNIPGVANWCATGGVDGILKIWNMNVTSSGGGSGAQLRQRCVRTTPEGEQVQAGITRLVWHTSLPLVICAYTDGNICIWDVRVGKLIKTVTGHEDMINDMCVNFVIGNGSGGEDVTTAVVVTGSDDRMVKMFEIPSSSLL